MVFHCEIGEKRLSVCQLDETTLSYRYGRAGSPQIRIDSVAIVSSRPWPGGGETRLRFPKGEYDYLVFDSIRYGDWLDVQPRVRALLEESGVHVTRRGKPVTTLSCSGTGEQRQGIDTSRLASKQVEAFRDLD